MMGSRYVTSESRVKRVIMDILILGFIYINNIVVVLSVIASNIYRALLYIFKFLKQEKPKVFQVVKSICLFFFFILSINWLGWKSSNWCYFKSVSASESVISVNY